MGSFPMVIATFFYSGRLPVVPGTWGSAAAVPFCWIRLVVVTQVTPNPLHQLIYYAISCFIVYLVGDWSVYWAAQELKPEQSKRKGEKKFDHQRFVIDEVHGMDIACMPLLVVDMNWWYGFSMAFVLFRIFDWLKLWPAIRFDRIDTPAGVMLDDLIAGIYAAICATALHYGYRRLVALLVFVAFLQWVWTNRHRILEWIRKWV